MIGKTRPAPAKKGGAARGGKRKADGGVIQRPGMKGGGLARKGVGMALKSGGMVRGAGCAQRGRGKVK